MEDGPESAEGSYEYEGKSYRLAEVDSEQWRVYDGDTYLGVVVQTDATAAEPWMHYASKPPGYEGDDLPTTDDWRAALRRLIETANL
ncbi:hypothetical protein [Curtobacterium sp. ISL-83]|uniref:hypothetical protein n=1 Tax=Curtobacterium sp. ISL-83 TaxID=2819145 RepID=UPI001BEAB98F|nr:hypothetical protein [Curtobacterium sp. ISL-83]MBT2501676.1 hypothetical protein [Curtobacterium sp. ISL-83]